LFLAGYEIQLNSFLPALSRLDEVVICVLADFSDSGWYDCDSEDEVVDHQCPFPFPCLLIFFQHDDSDEEYPSDFVVMNSAPEMKIIYHFSVARNSSQARVVLTNTEVSNPR
jgi:hypothetical protein